MPSPRTYITEVASLGVKPTNHDDDTSPSGPVAVPVLPAAGQVMAEALVPVPMLTTCCSAYVMSAAMSGSITCSLCTLWS